MCVALSLHTSVPESGLTIKMCFDENRKEILLMTVSVQLAY